MRRNMKWKLCSVLTVFALMAAMIAIPEKAGATGGGPEFVSVTNKKDGNDVSVYDSVYLNGNDAIIVADESNPEYGAIVKSAGKEFKISNDKKGELPRSTFVYAGSKRTDIDNSYETVDITMNGGNLNYIIGANHYRGTINTSNITIEGGKVGMVHGGARANALSGSLFVNCNKNQVLNTNIVMNNGTAGALVPGTFDLTYVKNANVTVNGGTLTAKTSPTQTGILSGTNGRIDNLSINVTGGNINGISLGQRTMITNKATINVENANIGDIYAGSYYADVENSSNDWWTVDKPGSINFGQAKDIEINVGENVVYNNIYGGFQYHQDKKLLDNSNKYPYNLMGVDEIQALVGNSNTAPLVMNLSSTPTKNVVQKETVEVIDSKESFITTNWKATGITLDKANASLEVGNTVKLNATVTPDKTTNKIVTWASSDGGVAKVDATGKVTAVSAGKANITATADGKVATCEVQVYKIEKPVLPTPPVNNGKDTTIEVNEKTTEVLTDTIKEIVNNVEAAKGVSEETKTALKKAISEGKQISVEAKTEKVDAKKVETKVVKEVEKVIAKDAMIAQYFDLSMMIKAEGTDLGTMNELSSKASFTVSVPTDLTKEGRTFYMVRIHNGVAEKIAGTLKGNEFTFESDKFSLFALVYEDAKPADTGDKDVTVDKEETEDKKDTSVDTGDSTNTNDLYTLLSLSVVALGALVFKSKFTA